MITITNAIADLMPCNCALLTSYGFDTSVPDKREAVREAVRGNLALGGFRGRGNAAARRAAAKHNYARLPWPMVKTDAEELIWHGCDLHNRDLD